MTTACTAETRQHNVQERKDRMQLARTGEHEEGPAATHETPREDQWPTGEVGQPSSGTACVHGQPLVLQEGSVVLWGE